MDAEFNGFVAIDRKILKWEWYKDIKVFKLFTHLIFKSNFKENSWQGNIIKRGQLITGLFSLSNETGLSVKEVRTALKKLISTGEISVKATNKFSIITVENYEKYQTVIERGANKGQTKGKQKANEGQQLNNDNNDNNIYTKEQIKLAEEVYIKYSSVLRNGTKTKAISQILKIISNQNYAYNDFKKIMKNYYNEVSAMQDADDKKIKQFSKGAEVFFNFKNKLWLQYYSGGENE